MAQKLLKAPRQLKITRQSTRRGLFDNNWVLAAGVILLLVLLVVALLFVQANKAVSDLKQLNQDNTASLRKSIDDTTRAVSGVNIQNQDASSKAMAALTELTTTTDRISETCADASKPLVGVMAKNQSQITNECTNITKNAREIRDAVNGFLPLAKYQTELVSALAPVIAYHKGEDKIDLEKGVTAWRETRDKLQQTTPSSALTETNTQLINISADMITQLEKAKAAKDADNTSEYTASLDLLAKNYKTLNALSEPLHKQLVNAQLELNKAVADLR